MSVRYKLYERVWSQSMTRQGQYHGITDASPGTGFWPEEDIPAAIAKVAPHVKKAAGIVKSAVVSAAKTGYNAVAPHVEHGYAQVLPIVHRLAASGLGRVMGGSVVGSTLHQHFMNPHTAIGPAAIGAGVGLAMSAATRLPKYADNINTALRNTGAGLQHQTQRAIGALSSTGHAISSKAQGVVDAIRAYADRPRKFKVHKPLMDIPLPKNRREASLLTPRAAPVQASRREPITVKSRVPVSPESSMLAAHMTRLLGNDRKQGVVPKITGYRRTPHSVVMSQAHPRELYTVLRNMSLSKSKNLRSLDKMRQLRDYMLTNHSEHFEPADNFMGLRPIED